MNIPNITLMLLRIPGLLFAMAIHEASHGYVSYLQGDDTPKKQGRLTLNPIVHIDIIGMISLMLLGFGWAKPVMTDPRNYKNPKLGMGLTALAGPLANIFGALLLAILLKVNYKYNFIQNQYLNLIIEQALQLNIFFAIFNMLPIPPLDGSKVLFIFLPASYMNFVYKYEMISQILLIACLFFAPYLLSYILTPGYLVVSHFINSILSILPF